jgi:hypothetical protein
VQICRKCLVKKGRVVNSRDELIWRQYLEDRLDPTYLLGCDKSLKSLGGCSMKRPDWISAYPEFVELGECDEKQHSGYNGGSSCEEARLAETYDEPGIIGKKMVVLRWNPDGYKPQGAQVKITSLKEKLETYVALRKHLLAHPPDDITNVYYLFYSPTNPLIMTKYPVHMIYSITDVETLSHSSGGSSSSSSSSSSGGSGSSSSSSSNPKRQLRPSVSPPRPFPRRIAALGVTSERVGTFLPPNSKEQGNEVRHAFSVAYPKNGKQHRPSIPEQTQHGTQKHRKQRPK